MKINLATKARTAISKNNGYTVVDGFEVWRDKGSWYAMKSPRAMSASTKKAILKMIQEN